MPKEATASRPPILIDLNETMLSYETLLGLLTARFLNTEKPSKIIKALEDEIVIIKKMYMGE